MLTEFLPVKLDELREIPAFRHLPDEQIESLVTVLVRRHYAPGQIIFIEGEQASSLWFVFRGRVKIIKQSLNGRIQGLCLMNQGKCFGSCPLFNMAKNPATAQALDHVTLFVLPEGDLQQLKASNPQLGKALLHIYSQRLGHLARVSDVLGTWTVPDRINDCLLTYANCDTQQPTVKLTHEKLAALSGTIREVVTRHLNLLAREGIVRNENGHIIILNPDALLPPCAREDDRVLT
ncbi:MAG: Crp/Fnr family transcriptional regulator [Anaerolineae bacterium]|nr:Crp/Fnr family transcriptional regulator [Anaerolineae bacterium]